MLKNHTTYEQTWSKQVESAVKIRESLTGRVNEHQKDTDLTLTEKVDGEFATKREVKKVLAKYFELANDSYARETWLNSLRSQTGQG